MSDEFRIIPYQVRSAGTDVPPEEVQAAINSLAQQVTIDLNILASQAQSPTGPAGGDLGGTYPNPTVVGLHVTTGTESGVTINSSPIGQTTPAAGAFTTLTATTPVGAASGGTGQNTLSAHNVLLGEGTGAVGFAAPGTSGQILASSGAAVDPSFQTKAALTIASSGANSDITSLSALSTPLSVAQGGTGRATLTIHGVLIGETTGAINQTAAGTTGQMLLGSTGADPAFGNNPTITGGTIDGAAIGGTTPSSGKFTTITASSTITPSSTAGIVGTTTNDNANAGSVGEFITATGTSVSLPIAGTTTNITSISLTAGDWDVSGTVQVNNSANVLSNAVAGISTTTGTQGAVGTFSQIATTASGAFFITMTQATPVVRLSLSGTTTVFLIASGFAASGTGTGSGVISARRRR
jgi:hypothetical protein